MMNLRRLASTLALPALLAVASLATGRNGAKPILTLRNANHPTISADCSRIVVMPEIGVIEAYQVSPKRKLRTFRRAGSREWLSGDGRRLAVNGDDGLSFWDVDTGQELARITHGIELVKPHNRWLSDDASFSSDLRFVAEVQWLLKRNGREESGVSLWDLKSRKLARIFSEEHSPKDHWGSVFLSPDGRLLAASRTNIDKPERDITVVWETETGRELLRLPFASWWLAISGDGRRLAAHHKVYGAGEALTFSILTSDKLRVEPTPGQRPPEPSRYLTEVWDIQSGKRVSVIEGGGREDPPATRAGAGVLSPDGKLLATSSLGYVVLWDAETGNLLASQSHDGHTPPREGIRTIAFSLDGRFLVTGSEPTEIVKIWSVEDLLRNARGLQ